jgi:hypothetical protein
MSAIVNDRDVLLQAAAVRLEAVTLPDTILMPAVKGLTLTAPGVNFQVTSGGVASPASYLLTATLKQVTGAISFTVTSGAATLTGTGSTRTLAYADVTVFPVTVRASVTDGATTYTADLTFTRVVDGSSGTRTAILDMYRWSATDPVTFPSGSSTFTWATGQFTAPATTNGWSLTPSAAVAGQSLYVVRQIFSDSLTSATSAVTWSATTSAPRGAAGANGQRVGFLEVYKWSASTPVSYPSGTSTYTWATGVFTAPTTANGWSLTPGAAVAGQTLWAISVIVSDALTTATSSATWDSTTPYAVGAAGTNGAAGTRAAIGYVYYTLAQASAPATPSASSFNYSTGAFTGLTAGWSTALTISTHASTDDEKWWASRYVITEATLGGAQTLTFSVAFAHVNFDGLVTFTNLATAAGTTFIDGGNIHTGSLSASTITAGSASDARGSVELLGFATVLKVTRNGVTTTPGMFIVDNATTTVPAAQVTVSASNTATNAFQMESASASQITLEVASKGVTSGAAKFLNYAGGFPTTGKEFWAAPGGYAAYSPSGKGKYYFVDGAGPFTGFHPALAPIATYTLGDIVVDDEILRKPDVNNAIGTCKLSTAANERGVLGVISEVRPLLGGWDHELEDYQLWWEMYDTHHLLDINGVGEGCINVCGAGGDIAKGDLIVASATPGKGMKQADDIVRSYTVAKAREGATFADPAEVKQIACIYIAG